MGLILVDLVILHLASANFLSWISGLVRECVSFVVLSV